MRDFGSPVLASKPIPTTRPQCSLEFHICQRIATSFSVAMGSLIKHHFALVALFGASALRATLLPRLSPPAHPPKHSASSPCPRCTPKQSPPSADRRCSVKPP